LMDADDWVDSKVVLALKIQRATKRCYTGAHDLDEEECATWRALMDDMAACAFEGYRGDALLAEALIDRVSLVEGKRLANL
jgi:hypothetical protein